MVITKTFLQWVHSNTNVAYKAKKGTEGKFKKWDDWEKYYPTRIDTPSETMTQRETFNKFLEQLGKNPKPKFKPMTNLEDSGFMGGIKED